MHLIHCLIVLGMLLLWTHELLLFENLRYVCVNNQWGFLCVSDGSFVEQTDDSEIRELGYQPAEQLSVLYWGNCVKQCCVPVKSDECCIFMHLCLIPSQLVQTAVIVFHRQWLDLRGSQEQTDPTGWSYFRLKAWNVSNTMVWKITIVKNYYKIINLIIN